MIWHVRLTVSVMKRWLLPACTGFCAAGDGQADQQGWPYFQPEAKQATSVAIPGRRFPWFENLP